MTSCHDVCIAVVEKLNEAGYEDKELQSTSFELDHDLIIEALGKLKVKR